MTKLSETCSSHSSSSSHVSLFSCFARALTSSLCPAASSTCLNCSRSVVFQRWGNVQPMSCGENGQGAWWELSSHRSSLYLGTCAASGRGPPSHPLSEWTLNKTLTNRWVTRVNVGFSLVCSFALPHDFFHSWLAHCFIFWQDWRKWKDWEREKQNSQSVGTFPCSFFLLPGAFSALTLLTQVFVHLWHWISGSASSLCAKKSIVSYFLFWIAVWKHI